MGHNFATEILDALPGVPKLNGFLLDEGEQGKVNISDFPKILDTAFFSEVTHIKPLTAKDRFLNKVELVTVPVGPDIKLNSEVTLYSIFMSEAFFYHHNTTDAKSGVQSLPVFVSEKDFKQYKQILVTLDLEKAQDTLAMIIGDEFVDKSDEIRKSIQKVQDAKTVAIRNQHYEEGARLRDKEKQLLALLEQAEIKRDEDASIKQARIAERSKGSIIQEVSRQFAEALSAAISDPQEHDVETYGYIFLRLTPDSFTYTINKEVDRSAQMNYVVPRSYYTK